MKTRCFICNVLCFIVLIILSGCGTNSINAKKNDRKPNIIIVMTDDQGYGDLGCHGNPILKTPNLDAFHDESIHFTDFHVNTLCTPTRAALLTGKYARKVGTQSVIRGKSLMRGSETTMAEVFKEAGYKTAMFGKWHLGDNYPFRPQDQGFEEVISFNNGGLEQLSDYWGNDYFDDTYLHNGVYEKHEGYCTNVWFNESMKWMKQQNDKPFFLYLPTNEPHNPLYVSEEYSKQYEELSEKMSKFYGMITNLDDNMGKLFHFLKEEGLEENTILIFMTDNGSTAPRFDRNAYNGGQKGDKYNLFDGGHRVPFFIRWPGGGLIEPCGITTPTAHIDILPTLMSLVGVENNDKLRFDGVDISDLLRTDEATIGERAIIVNNTFQNYPLGRQGYSVVKGSWRLILRDGKPSQLFDVESDAMQDVDISAKYPEVVDELENEHEKWLAGVVLFDNRYEEIILGSPKENPTVLGAFDWHALGAFPGNHTHVKENKEANGWWAINIQEEGKYSFRLRHWPDESGLPVSKEKVRVKIGMIDSQIFDKNLYASQTKKCMSEIDATGNAGEEIVLHLEEGSTQIKTWMGNQGKGAHYVYVEKLNN